MTDRAESSRKRDEGAEKKRVEHNYTTTKQLHNKTQRPKQTEKTTRKRESSTGLEPAISRFVGGCLIHWATRTTRTLTSHIQQHNTTQHTTTTTHTTHTHTTHTHAHTTNTNQRRQPPKVRTPETNMQNQNTPLAVFNPHTHQHCRPCTGPPSNTNTQTHAHKHTNSQAFRQTDRRSGRQDNWMTGRLTGWQPPSPARL